MGIAATLAIGWFANDVWSKWYYDRIYKDRHPKMMWPWTPKARKRAECFHHDRPAWAKGEVDSRSFIREQIIGPGRKLYECVEKDGGCGKLWFG